jgi:hypothetical protein
MPSRKQGSVLGGIRSWLREHGFNEGSRWPIAMLQHVVIDQRRSSEDHTSPKDPNLSIANAGPVRIRSISKLSLGIPLSRRNAAQVAGVKSPGHMNNIVILAELEKPRFEIWGSLTLRVRVLATQPANVDRTAAFRLMPRAVCVDRQILIVAHDDGCGATNSAERTHAGPKSTDREAELRRPSGVVCSDLVRRHAITMR